MFKTEWLIILGVVSQYPKIIRLIEVVTEDYSARCYTIPLNKLAKLLSGIT